MKAIVRAWRRARICMLSPLAVAGLVALSVSGVAHAAGAADAGKLSVVAAENFYGDVARQIGGSHIEVTSILSNPDQDPHLFEASPRTARAIERAAIVVYNGADYDPWMQKLLAAQSSGKRTTIVAAELVGKKSGDNPHLWYAPGTMPAVARAIEAALAAAAPEHKADFEANLKRFDDSIKPIEKKVGDLQARYKGTPVTATEPVFGYMADAIGLDMRNGRFQLAVMNDTEPSASDIAAFERDLRTRTVHALIYNSQATEALTKRLLGLAHQSGVPTVSVTETMPAGKTYQQWMLAQLDALAAALGKTRP